ncbi:MAG: NAD(P)-binding domain-containing protein [Dysgonomonas sp.]
MTKTVFIGAGNLATNLATELKNHSFQIVQVFSRTISSARILANKTDCDYTDDMRNIITDADLYIFSISDSALPEILLKMPQTSGVWVHTAGSIPMDIFKTYASNYGVVYPFQTFSKNRIIAFKNIPVFVEANNNETLNCLKKNVCGNFR